MRYMGARIYSIYGIQLMFCDIILESEIEERGGGGVGSVYFNKKIILCQACPVPYSKPLPDLFFKIRKKTAR